VVQGLDVPGPVRERIALTEKELREERSAIESWL